MFRFLCTATTHTLWNKIRISHSRCAEKMSYVTAIEVALVAVAMGAAALARRRRCIQGNACSFSIHIPGVPVHHPAHVPLEKIDAFRPFSEWALVLLGAEGLVVVEREQLLSQLVQPARVRHRGGKGRQGTVVRDDHRRDV